jgi:hypothetical protein
MLEKFAAFPGRVARTLIYQKPNVCTETAEACSGCDSYSNVSCHPFDNVTLDAILNDGG